MAINSFNVNTSTVVGGLGTQTCNVVTAGIYTLAVNLTIPYIASGTSGNSTVTTGGSSCQVVVNQNGTPVLTIAAPVSPYAATTAGSVRITCAANDVITVVLSSAAAVDNTPNAIKGTINFYQGE